MRNRFKILLSIIITLIILLVVILISLSFKGNNSKKEYKVLEKIDNYNYVLEDRDSLLMEETFKKLKTVLEKAEIDYNLYAEYLSELFIIDLYTLDNKNNKYDVGSSEYVYYDILENYKLNVENTLYKYIRDINSDDRGALPRVASIKKESIEDTTYKYKDNEFVAYKVLLSFTYEENLGYDNYGEVILINDNNKLYVISYKGEVRE